MVYRGPAGWQKTGPSSIAPRPSSQDIDIQADVIADDIDLGDDDTLDFGDDEDYSLGYNTSPGTNRFELTNPNGNRVVDVEDTTQNVRVQGGLSVDGEDAPTSGLAVTSGSSLSYPDDAGAETLANFTVTGTPGAGTEESIAIAVNGTSILTAYAEADGGGGLQNQAVRAEQDLDLRGNSLVDTSRGYIDLSGDSDDVRMATGAALEDGGGTKRLDIVAGGTLLNYEDGSTAVSADSSNFIRLNALSSAPLIINDGQQSATAVQYDTDATAGVLRTPGAGLGVESDGLPSSGSGMYLGYNGSVGEITTFDFDTSTRQDVSILASTIKLDSRGGLIDASPTGADLRLATGQAIEDGGGTQRLLMNSNGSYLKNAAGDTMYEAGSRAEIRAYSAHDFVIEDREGVFDAVTYTTSASAPGEMDFVNSDLRLSTNRIVEVDDLNMSGTSTDYSTPGSNQVEIWNNDGGGSTGADGDLLVASNDSSGSGAKSGHLFDYSDGTVSSERYKTDLRPLSDELDPYDLLDVSGRAWTDKGRGNTALGFSADELNQVHDRLTRDTTLTEDDDWADEEYMEKWGYEYGDEVPNEPRLTPILAAHHDILRDLVAWAEEQGYQPGDGGVAEVPA